MRRILITSIGGDVGNAIARCLFDADNAVFGCDIKKYVADMDRLAGYVIVPRYDDPAYWPAVQDALARHGITHFIPSSEQEIVSADKHRQFFIQQKIALVMNHSRIIHTLTSKYRTAKFLGQGGLDVPATYYPQELPDDPHFPLIVKPDEGRGSFGVIKVNDGNSLTAALCQVPNPVIQAYVGSPEKEYTVGVFRDDRNVRSIGFLRRLGYGGMSVQVETVRDPALTEIAERAAKLLELQGAINIQLRYHEGVYYIFEINPRLSSTVAFRHQMGFCDAHWWLDLVDGKSIPPYREVPAGIVGLKTTGEQLFYPEQGE